MARIGSYPIDAVIQDKDAWIGTQNTNRVTRQFTALGVAEYIDTKNVGLVFVGATNLLSGAKGLVPAPVAGQEGMYLKGNLGGGWTTIPVYTLDVPTGTTNVNLINTDGAGGIINSFITLTGGTYLTSVHTSGTQITFNHDLTTRTDTASASSPAAGGTVDIVSSVTSNATGHIEAVNIETVTWPADSDTTYTIDVPNATTSINLAGSDGTNDPIAFTTLPGTGNNGMTVTRTDANTLDFNSKWQLNTVLVEGYVPKGQANANKFWATDVNGNPGWTFQPSQDQVITSVGNSNITTGIELSQNGQTVFIRGAGTITASSDNTNRIITLTGTDQNTIYTLPVAAGAANSAVINLTDNAAAVVSEVTFNGTPTGIAISEAVGNNGSITIGLQEDITVTGELTVSGADRSSFIGQVTIPQTPLVGTDAASKAYVDGLVAGGLTFIGTFRADTGEILSGINIGLQLYNCPGGAGTRVAVAVGDYYIVATAAGSFYCSGVTLDIGDSIIATTAAAADASVVGEWSVVQSDEGVATFTNVNGTFVSASTVNTDAAGAVTMGTIDLSAGGLSGSPADAATQFLRGDNTWDVPDGTYDLPVATLADLGGIKLGSSTALTEGYETGGVGASGQTYPVQLNAANQAGVSVPWTNLVTSVSAEGATSALSGLTSTPTTGAVVIGLDINGRASLGVPVGGDELMIYDASTTKNVKVRVDDLAQYVGDGTAVANQVTYWTSANNIGGGTGFTFAGGANGAITMGGTLTVGGDAIVKGIFSLWGNNSALAGQIQANSSGGGLYLNAVGTNQNIRLVPSGTGYVQVTSLLDVTGNLSITGNSTFAGSVSATGVIFANRTLEVLGQNLTHGASRIKICQENTTKSQIRYYGADASTKGSLEFMASSSDGSLSVTPLSIYSSGLVQIGASSGTNYSLGINGDTFELSSKKDGTDAIATVFKTQDNAGGLAERMRIEGSGDVGIGVVTPANLLSAYNTSSTSLASLTISGIALNGTGGGNRQFNTFTNASTTSFTGTDAVDQGYGYFDFGSGGFAANTTYTIHFKSVSVNGYIFQIITTSGLDFNSQLVKNITKYPLPVSGDLYSLTFTMDGTSAQYLGFGAVRESGTMSLAISEVSVIQGKPDTETGSLVAYKGIVAEGPAVSQYLTSTSGSQASLFIGRSIDTQAKITSGDVSANDLCFYVNNTRRLVIENGGNVGIGTDSPDFALDIEAVSSGVQLQIGRTTTSAGSTWMGSDSNGFHLGVGAYGSGNSVSDPNGFTVLTSGNVGIGKPAPVYQLDVLGSGTYGGMIQVKNTDAQQYPRVAIQSDVKGYHIGVGGSSAGAGYANNLYFYDNNEGVVRMVIDTVGNVGIGTDSPSYGKLQIDQTSGNNLTLRKGTGQPAIAFGGVDNDEAVCLVEGNGASGGLKFYNGTGTLASPTWSAGMEFFDSGRLYPYGGVYLGAASSSNLLDDYEEGTWNVGTSSTGSNMTNIAFTNEKYTKIGNLVTYSFNLSGSFTSAATESSVGFNLPFTADSTQYKSVGIVSFFIGAAPNRFGLGAIFLGTTSATLGFIYIAGREVQQSGAWGDMRVTATFFAA